MEAVEAVYGMVGLFQELLEGIQADRGIGWQGWGWR